MSREREEEVIRLLEAYSCQEVALLAVELIKLRRERYRDKLEDMENAENRGRARECKDLIRILG